MNATCDLFSSFGRIRPRLSHDGEELFTLLGSVTVCEYATATRPNAVVSCGVFFLFVYSCNLHYKEAFHDRFGLWQV